MGGNALSGSTLGDGTAGEHAFAWTGAQTGQYGTVTLNPNGTYSYTLNNDSAAVQALVEGATLTETFTYTYTDKDGDPATGSVTITITGTEDKPTVESFEHDIAEDSGAYTVGGNALSGSTLGDGPAGEHAFAWTGAQTGQYGTVTLNPNGTYSYTLNNDSAAVQAGRSCHPTKPSPTPIQGRYPYAYHHHHPPDKPTS